MKLKDLNPDPRNANKGTARGQKMIVSSIQEDGFGRSGLLDRNGQIIAGNKTAEASAEVFGVDTDVIVVETDGKKPVYVKRTDLDLADPDPNNPARRLAYRDNLASRFSFELDAEVVMADIEAGFDFEGIDIGIEDIGNLLERITNGALRSTQATNDPYEEWQGMPEFENEDAFGAVASIKVHFAQYNDLAKFAQLIEQNITENTKYIWFPKQEKENLKEYAAIDES